MEQVSMSFEVEKIRKLFREFYGCLPINELSQNEDLIFIIEKIESQLRRLVETEPTA
jgi:hypothetical protein